MPQHEPELTPRQIVAELDRDIVGQADAKRAVAIALRNRWRRRQLPDELRDDLARGQVGHASSSTVKLPFV